MAILKVIEVMTESSESWEHATQLAVDHANSTVRNIRSAYIQDFSAVVADGKIKTFRVNAKVSFEVE